MSVTNPKKFDPARAHVLDAPDREVFLPTHTLIEALALRGDERVVDYGAGAGREVLALEENEQMCEHLSAAIVGSVVQPLLVSGNRAPLLGGWADRMLAINLLHEARGEPALGRCAGCSAEAELTAAGLATDRLELDLQFPVALRTRAAVPRATNAPRTR